jgi:hypothetical protein
LEADLAVSLREFREVAPRQTYERCRQNYAHCCTATILSFEPIT